MLARLFSHLPLQKRIYTGYILIGALSCLLITLSSISFEQIETQFQHFLQFSKESQYRLKLTRDIRNLHNTARRFTHQDQKSAAQRVHMIYSMIQEQLKEYQTFAAQPAAPSSIDTIIEHLKVYYSTFKQVEMQINMELLFVNRFISEESAKIEWLIKDYLTSQSSQTPEIKLQTTLILNRLLMMEKNTDQYFYTLDGHYIQLTDQHFKQLREELIALTQLLPPKSRDTQATAEILNTLVNYRNTFLNAVQRTRGVLYLVNVVMAAEAFEMLYQIKQLEEATKQELNQTEQDIFAIIKTFTRRVLGVSLGIIALIFVLSYGVGLSIARPLETLTRIFNRLSSGSSDEPIPAYPLQDEIGALTDAAKVFRNKNLELQQLLKQYQELSEQLEQKVFDRTQELEQSNRELVIAKETAESATRAKTQFLANMSHEIRTPINAIISLSYLINQTELTSAQQKLIHSIELASNSLLSIINEILDFSKIEAGKLKIERIKTDLYQVIDQVLYIAGSGLDENRLHFYLDYGYNVQRFYQTDPLRISQILTNLINNAVKFTEQGEIGIKVRQQPDDILKFTVWDTGIGLTEEQQKRLFQAFTQADESTTRKYGGTGLGLTICQQLVELMEGQIWIKSQADEGSQFIFTLKMPALEQPDLKSNLHHALVLEPDRKWQRLLTNQLTYLGLEVSCLQNLSHLKLTESFDAVFIAVSLLGQYDTATLDYIKTIARHRIILTYYEFDNDSSIDRNHPAFTLWNPVVMKKPFNPGLLLRALDESQGILSSCAEPPLNQRIEELQSQVSQIPQGRLLLVEDNQMNRSIFHQLLSKSNLVITDANNGQEAVEQFRESPDSFDLILMDIQMPVMDGYQSAHLIRNINPEVPIIALTANITVKNREDIQFNGFLSKPIDIEKLFQTLLEFIPDSNLSEPPVMASNSDSATQLPEFKFIDTSEGLIRSLQDVDFYQRQLLNFAREYGSVSTELAQWLINEPERARTIVHNLKSQSGSLGAREVYLAAKQLEQDQTQSHIDVLIKKLQQVIQEINERLQPVESPTEHNPPLSNVRYHEILHLLERALQTRRPKQINPLVNELQSYTLDDEQNKLIGKILPLIAKYHYKDALSQIQKYDAYKTIDQ